MPLEGEGFLPGPGVPHLHRPIATAGGEPLAVGAERHAPDIAGVPLEGEGFLPGPGVPHLHRPVLTGGGEPLAVGAERHAQDVVGMPLEGEGLPARSRRPTPSPSGPQLAEASRLPSGLNATLVTCVGVPLEGEGFLPGRGVPHLHRPVTAGGGEPLAVGAERHALDTRRCAP